MANIEKLCRNLEREGFLTSAFDAVPAAMQFLNHVIDGTTVGFGGSQTVRDMGLYEALAEHNACYWHWNPESREIPIEATTAPVYISGVNGVSENGELINIDGRGNRLASTLYGHEKVFLIIGENKIAPDYDAALWRARNIAAPLNAKRLNAQTPCVQTGKCMNCAAPGRICRALLVLWDKPAHAMEIEVVIIRQTLGY